MVLVTSKRSHNLGRTKHEYDVPHFPGAMIVAVYAETNRTEEYGRLFAGWTWCSAFEAERTG